MKLFSILVISWLMPFLAFAQSGGIRDLGAELAAGRLQLVSMAGNGSSSGMAVTGQLVNTSSSTIRVDVVLGQPILLVNSGPAQNMVVSGVYLEDGGYMTDSRGAGFIEIRPKARVRVVLIAYCADFEKDNPGPSDRFTVASLPAKLGPVMTQVQTYSRRNPAEDITAAAQAAVWMAQGVSISKIREKFEVSPGEERLARNFIR